MDCLEKCFNGENVEESLQFALTISDLIKINGVSGVAGVPAVTPAEDTSPGPATVYKETV